MFYLLLSAVIQLLWKVVGLCKNFAPIENIFIDIVQLTKLKVFK